MSVRTIVAKAAQVVAGAANYLGRTRAGLQFRMAFNIVGARVRAGFAFTRQVLNLSVRVTAGVAFSLRQTGLYKALVRPGFAFANRSTLNAARPYLGSSFKITQTMVNLVRTVGATTVVQEAVGGRSDWTTPANAQGKRDGTTSTGAGNALGARAGRLVGTPPPSVNKGALNITSVVLNFYVSQAGTVAGNGTLQLGYRVSGGGDVVLATITADTASLTTPLSYNLTAVVGNSWPVADTLKWFVYFSTPVLNTSTVACDAVELVIQANKTEIL